MWNHAGRFVAMWAAFAAVAAVGCVTQPPSGSPPSVDGGLPCYGNGPSPCAATQCAAGSECRVYEPTCEAYCADTCVGRTCPGGQHCALVTVQCVRAPCPPVAECVADTGPIIKDGCLQGGCSGEICTDPGGPTVSPCIALPQYACYRNATCERQADGHCDWTQTPALEACLANPPTTN